MLWSSPCVGQNGSVLSTMSKKFWIPVCVGTECGGSKGAGHADRKRTASWWWACRCGPTCCKDRQQERCPKRQRAAIPGRVGTWECTPFLLCQGCRSVKQLVLGSYWWVRKEGRERGQVCLHLFQLGEVRVLVSYPSAQSENDKAVGNCG